MTDRPVVRRTGGRSSRVLDSIYTAVGELVGARAEKITFPVIAERAGVNPTTLYRRWVDVDALLEEVTVAALTRDADAAPDTGSVRGDLEEWAGLVVQDVTRPERVRFLRAMVGARTDLITRCLITEKRRDQASDVVGRAVERGEAAPSVAQILDHVIAPIYYRVVFALEVTDADARCLVDDVLAMAR
ncbi:TetR/AcrR family transcriptional regulator [Frondihabitans australicus]|uniref:TetR family transcriptional regulator n=1 Tax=Frondihabitans australicus TaxID=386892 RepID=A0A495IAZ5_9MICO|nr:TetR/AcrR family transcriptional regulator [Frondihabitans australicus]RKR73082.1 TetR family transcriptional regulator [Frondihabitans australicus]